jgi:hypothetical protein
MTPATGGRGRRTPCTTPPAKRMEDRNHDRRCRSPPMRTTLDAVAECYFKAKTQSRGTRNEYFSTLRK